MRKLRFPIAGLMAAVLVIALGLAALRNASVTWAGSTFLLTCAVLCLALVGVVCRHGTERAWWLGFALFGWGYLFLAFYTSFELPTMALLNTDRLTARHESPVPRQHERPRLDGRNGRNDERPTPVLRRVRRRRRRTAGPIPATDRSLPLGAGGRTARRHALHLALRRPEETLPKNPNADPATRRRVSQRAWLFRTAVLSLAACVVVTFLLSLPLAISPGFLGRRDLPVDVCAARPDHPGRRRRARQPPPDLARCRTHRRRLHDPGLRPTP